MKCTISRRRRYLCFVYANIRVLCYSCGSRSDDRRYDMRQRIVLTLMHGVCSKLHHLHHRCFTWPTTSSATRACRCTVSATLSHHHHDHHHHMQNPADQAILQNILQLVREAEAQDTPSHTKFAGTSSTTAGLLASSVAGAAIGALGGDGKSTSRLLKRPT